ncbi:pyruvate/2-oxoglutarate dehydrogenase complex dihydrolipoamide acyltransferase (E2) component [Crossiella equi]|uniref:Pyruvate/2-oxoglutarate dehydrogenase complex dihydrolipoamide acyltransferase (E2) component n=1 Tax=Crossiella equi TaxID=130796 RepID=A0ABS5A787_9PSEU|nr:hypothetical protein [Crossiella equi]MBP2472176.1 pyruvate/2-oxoglutarate dehydrogenase complex dihydrolipoamide acyltransferase (E2) component [Crossiella equi]
MPATRLAAGVVTALAVTAVALGAAALAAPAAAPPPRPLPLAAPAAAPAAGAENVPPHSVEDFVHPDAERLKAERNITLRKGNGGIRLVDCGPGELIRLSSAEVPEPEICFQVTRVPAPGVVPAYLAMELQDVYLIRTTNQATTAKITVSGQTTEKQLEKDKWNSIGSGTGTGAPPATLLELRVTP